MWLGVALYRFLFFGTILSRSGLIRFPWVGFVHFGAAFGFGRVFSIVFQSFGNAFGVFGFAFLIVFRALSTVVSIGMGFLHRRAPSVSAGPLATFVSVLYLNVRDGREHFAGRYFSPIFGKIDSRREREIFILFEFPGIFCEFSGLFLFLKKWGFPFFAPYLCVFIWNKKLSCSQCAVEATRGRGL